MILPCDCKHPVQDKLNGKGLRVCNPTKKEGMARCTVCSNMVRIK